jgi:hypothetical protein
VSASVNGWRVLTRDQCADVHVPGGTLPVHPALAPIFADLATRYHSLVEPLEWPGCWGFNDRPIRGSKMTSNHASGTAVDLNAPRHPQGVPASKTFTRGQISAISLILTRYHGLIEWGGAWDLPDTDGMHFELRKGATFEQVTAVTAQLAKPDPPKPKPKPAPKPSPARWAGPDLTGTGPALRGAEGNSGPRVAAWQAWLHRYAPAYAGDLAADGVWGPKTSTVNREFARRSGIGSADGRNIGPQLAAAYWRAGLFRTLSTAQTRAVARRARHSR